MTGRRGLLEREGDLQELEELLDRVVEQRDGGTVLIAGVAGIGKSRLLTAAVELAQERGARVLRAAGAELEFELAFGCVRQLFATEVLRLPSRERETALAGPARLARPTLGLESEAHSDDLGDPLYGLFWLAANLAERRPLVLVVDDLHWIDEESGRFIAYLARRLEGMPILLVAATRPSEPGARHDPAAALAGSGRVIGPEPLSPHAIAQLLETTWGEAPSTSVVADAHRATGGNPFLVGELARSLASREGAAALAATAPATVANAVLSRVASVSPDAEALAQATALFPAGATLRDAAAVAALDPARAAAAADGLVTAGVFAPADRLEFLHPIMRAAVYEHLGDFSRRRGHARAAKILLARGAVVEDVASHLLAGEPGGENDGVRVLREAADAAVASGALRAAARYLERALQEPPPLAERAMLRRELGHLQAMVGDDRAESTLERALAEAEVGEARVDVTLDLAAVRLGRMRSDDAVEVLLAARDTPGLERERRLLVSAMLAAAAWSSSRFPRLYIEITEELDAGLAGETPGECLVLTQAAGNMFDRCEPHEQVRQVLLRALGHGTGRTVAIGGSDAGDPLPLLIACGGLADAEEVCRSREAHARSTGNDALYAATQVWLWRIAFLRGDLRTADAITRLALALPGSHPAVRATFLTGLISELLVQGKHEEARASLLAIETAATDTVESATVQRRWAQLALAEGRPHDAIPVLESARDVFARRGSLNPAETTFLTDLGLALAAVGRSAEALELLSGMRAQAERFGEPRPIGLVLMALGRVLDGREALSSFEQAVAILEPTVYRLDAAFAKVELGSALRRANRRVDARELLRPTLDYALRHDIAPLAARAEEELRATGARPRRLVLTGIEALTPSEARIARLAAEGLTNRQIAQQLFLTVKTIEMHLAAAYRKLEIRSRKELPALMKTSERSLGLVSSEHA